VEHALLGFSQPFNLLPEKVNAGSDDEPVVLKILVVDPHSLSIGLDGRGHLVYDLDAVAPEPVVPEGQPPDRLNAAQHEVAERTGDELFSRLDENDFDGRVREADVLSGGCSAPASADHDDTAASAGTVTRDRRRASGKTGQPGNASAGVPHKLAPREQRVTHALLLRKQETIW
jgi:hypothetical protein